MIQPMLDDLINEENSDQPIISLGGILPPQLNISKEDALNYVERCFLAAAERDVTIGDGIEIYLLEKQIDLRLITPNDALLPIVRNKVTKWQLKLPAN
jgi:20S proteasome alpha/beta subunit